MAINFDVKHLFIILVIVLLLWCSRISMANERRLIDHLRGEIQKLLVLAQQESLPPIVDNIFSQIGRIFPLILI